MIASTTLESETNFFTRDEPRRPGRDGLVDGLCTRGTCFSGAAASSNTPATLVDCRDASELDSAVAGVLDAEAVEKAHVPLVHKPSTKPSRPGRRGSSRVKKFVSDSSVVEAPNGSLKIH